MSSPREPLLSAAFLELCMFNFAASAAVFALLPVAPYRIHDLGGPTAAAGLFLGSLTFASALSAPFTGALGDRLGQGRVLAVAAAAIATLFAIYAFVAVWPLFVALGLRAGDLLVGSPDVVGRLRRPADPGVATRRGLRGARNGDDPRHLARSELRFRPLRPRLAVARGHARPRQRGDRRARAALRLRGRRRSRAAPDSRRPRSVSRNRCCVSPSDSFWSRWATAA